MCNNETLTGVELIYAVQELQGDSWVSSIALKIAKQPIEEEGRPMVTWYYRGAVGK